MLNNIKYIIFVFVIMACGHQEVIVDSRLAPYMIGVENVSARIGEFPGEPDIAGRCYVYSMSVNLIIISEKHWNSFNEKQKQWLMQHELGHCAELLDHDNTLDSNGCPTSKMFWRVPDWRCLN